MPMPPKQRKQSMTTGQQQNSNAPSPRETAPRPTHAPKWCAISALGMKQHVEIHLPRHAHAPPLMWAAPWILRSKGGMAPSDREVPVAQPHRCWLANVMRKGPEGPSDRPSQESTRSNQASPTREKRGSSNHWRGCPVRRLPPSRRTEPTSGSQDIRHHISCNPGGNATSASNQRLLFGPPPGTTVALERMGRYACMAALVMRAAASSDASLHG